MIKTKVAERDLKHALKFVQLLLSVSGVWPIPIESPFHMKILQWIIASIFLFLQMFVMGPGILYVFIRENNRKNQLKQLCLFINCLGQLVKYVVTLNRMYDLRVMLDEIRNDWLVATEENRRIFRMKADIGHKVVLIVAFMIYSGGLCYRVILPLLKGRVTLPNNTTIRLLPCPAYFPFIDLQATPYYEIIYICQVLGGFCNYTVICSTVGIFSMLSLHMCALLNILSNKLIDLSDGSNSEEILQEKIVDIVQHQTKLKRFLSNAELITQHLCFYEIAVVTVVTCLIGYCLLLEWEDQNTATMLIYLELLLTWISTTYIICYIGQLFIDESNNVAQTCIKLKWYRFATKKARCLILVILMSNCPMKMTAAKVLDISLTTFADVSIKKSDLRMNQHLYAMQNIYFLVPKGVFGLPKHAAKSHLKYRFFAARIMRHNIRYTVLMYEIIPTCLL
ncbi:Odorant receptor 43a [Eufriesea mexicana]|nr:Odorant receptor 43a [Eufriesea mexicana]